jgi:hypothetical protein
MKKLFRQRIVQWLCAATLAVAIPAGFVAAVDPFGYFGLNTIGYYYSSERQFKQALLRAANYNALVIGDSRIAYTDPALITLPQYKFINGGLAGSTFSEQIDLLFDARFDDLDLVVMGITPGTLTVDRNCRQEPKAEASWWDPILFSASWTQVWYTAVALSYVYEGKRPYYRADGTRSTHAKDETDAELPDKNDRYWRAIRREAERSQYLYQKSQFGMIMEDNCLELVARARALGDQRGFRVVVVLLPINRDYFGGFNWRAWLRAEQSLRSLARLRAAAHHVVNFADSAYSDSGNFWRHDPEHFKPNVGARLIEEAIRISEGDASSGETTTRH